MKVKRESTMLHHVGGTKFYEVTKIFTDGGEHVVVYRWGKMSEVATGGQCKVEGPFPSGTAAVLTQRKLSEKRKRGYADADGYSITSSSFDGEVARLKLNELFDDSRAVTLIMSGLGLTDILSASDVNHLFGRDDIVVEEPEPEIERGEEWASW